MNGITKIWLCAGIPIDPTQRHFRIFSSGSEYFEWTKKYSVWSVSEYTYQRETESLYVEGNADRLKNVNYIAYTNGTNIFYGFVDIVEYENDNTVRISFTPDYFSTWFNSLILKPCFVERETVSNDTIGLHTVDEGLQGEYTVTNTDSFKCGNLYVYGAFTEDLPGTSGVLEPPQIIGGFPQAVYIGKFGSLSSFSVGVIKSVIDAYASEGKSSAIVGFFTAPENFVSTTNDIRRQIWTVSQPSLTSHVKNNKLFCYPFTSLQIQSGGNNTVFKYEDFTEGLNFEIMGGFGENMNVLMRPVNYQNVAYNNNYAVTLNGFPTLNWLSNNYQNYQAQKNAALTTQSYVNVGQAVTSAAAGAAIGSIIPGAGTAAGAMTGFATSLTAQLLPSTLSNIGELFRSMTSSSFITSTLNGSANAADIMAISQQLGFYANCKTLKPEFLEMFDDYFSMFGYRVNITKTPELFSRKCWNFIKTQGFMAQGNAPAPALKQISNIFNNGVTLWHTDDVGNYNLNNTIV